MKKKKLLLSILLTLLLALLLFPVTTQAATLKAPKTLTVKQGRNNISVQWSKVSGAKGYVVYRKTSPSQGWKRLKVVKAPTVKYLDKNIASGKSYYYTVRPYTNKSGKNSYGSYNKSGRNTVYLKEPKVTATKSHKSVTLKWNKTTGASGYEVYRKSGSSGYSKLDTTTALSYTDKNVKPSTKYTYAVRAYKKSGKTTFRSLYYDDQNLVDVKTNKEPEVTPEPEVDINDVVESKVYVNNGSGIIEIFNNTNISYYGVKYKIDFYDDNNALVYRISNRLISNYLRSNEYDYDRFSVPENFSYSSYKIKLTNNHGINNSLLNNLITSNAYIKDDFLWLPLTNTSNEYISVLYKIVTFYENIPVSIDISSCTLKSKETKDILLWMIRSENILDNNYKVKLIIRDIYTL